MSPTASIAATVMVLWVAGSVCHAFQIGRLGRLTRRINRFRTFDIWTMFSAPADPTPQFGTYSVEYRDEFAAKEADGSGWIVVTGRPVWRPYGWLMNPQRARAEALHRLGRSLEHARQRSPEEPPSLLPYAEAALAAHIARYHPQPAGTRRHVRLVRNAGPDPTTESVILISIDTPRAIR